MNNSNDNGGPAFPRTGYYPDTTGRSGEALREQMPTMTEPEKGMSLRDYFAAKAMTGFVCNSSFPDLLTKFFNPDGAAEACYAIADAMLKERRQRRERTAAE